MRNHQYYLENFPTIIKFDYLECEPRHRKDANPLIRSPRDAGNQCFRGRSDRGEGMRTNTSMDATECRQPGTDRLRNSRTLRRRPFSEWVSNVSPELWLPFCLLVRCRSQSHCIFCLPFPIFHLTSPCHPHPMHTLSTVHHKWPRAASGQFTFPLDTDAIRFFIASSE